MNHLTYDMLDPEQLAAIDRLYETDETMLIAGLGFGKCIVGLTAAQQLIQDGHLKRILVLAPKQVADLTWRMERHAWSHIDADMIGVATGTAKQREQALKPAHLPEPAIVVANFENVEWILDQCGDSFDGLLIDESTKLKSPGSAGVRKLRHFAKHLAWRVSMSGTPVAEQGEDIYAQALLIDSGKALGTNVEGFKRKYMYPTDYQNRNWEFHPGSREVIAARLSSVVYMADDARYQAQLPRIDDHTHPVFISEDACDLYDAMEMRGVCAVNGIKVRAESAGIRANKLHCIAAGGLYGKDAEQEQVLAWHDPFKIHYFDLLYRGKLDTSPLIVVYQYRFELEELLRRYPGTPVMGGGGKGNKFTPEHLELFQEGKIPLVFMHMRSGAHGLNLQYACNTILHLSPIWGRDPWAQCLGRIRRRSQPKDVVHRHTLVGLDTIDEEALERLGVKAEREKLFMDELAAVD